MPSRKRAKGRERKLKQQARESVERSVSQAPPNGGNINLPEQIIRMIEQPENVKCKHGGFKHNSLQGHLVNAFVDSFMETMNCEDRNLQTITDCMNISFEKHREVWEIDTMRKMAIDRMVGIGTDTIINGCIYCARMISISIMLLKNYDGEGFFHSTVSKGTEDLAYLLNAEERDVVHFYKKETPCSCLDELYSEFKKNQVRGGQCYYCKQTIKRKDLMTCSRCKFAQYCSKECQKLDWPSHKEQCILHSRLHKDVKKAETARSKKE